MAQDPRKLRKLLDILSQYGVTKYKSEDVEIELISPVALAQNLYASSEDDAISVANNEFSMDNYDKAHSTDIKSTGNSNANAEGYMGYSDEEILNWSAG